MMPEMDGFAFLEEFRKLPSSAAVPVIVLTAKDLTGEDQKQLHGRVVRVITKGEGMDSLLKGIQELVSSPVGASRVK